MKTLVNVKLSKKCAICKYWYDPTNSVISPKQPKSGIWEISDNNIKRKCLKSNLDCFASFSCRHFECKL